MTAAKRKFAARIIRNLVVTVAVTAIFGLKAAELQGAPAPDPMTLAAQ